ncbi:MAG: hypothetical protein JWM47_2191 [Acidimicrobiales bacterium]|nr:hypothetical protein [Acidimicrobiales bacterium]
MAPGDLSAVLSQLAAVTTRLERVERSTGALETLGGLSEQFAALHEQFEELTGLVAAAQGDDDSPDGPRISPIWWPALSDEDFATLRRELRGWLRDVLAARYPRDAQRLTRCWEDHPVAVDLLTTLWVTWAAGLLARSADARDAAEWHLKWRPELIEAASEELDNCRRGHRAPLELDPDLVASFEPDREPAPAS